MAFTLYDATVVVVKDALTSLDNILTKAEKEPNPERFIDARLYEDMKPLSFQIYTVCRFNELLLARLSGREPAEHKDDLKSFAEMHARIAQAQELLAQADKDTINRVGEEVAPTALPSFGSMDLAGKAFAMGAAMPNINFHVCMTYAILRKEGVPLGKWDYGIGPITNHILPGKPQA